MTRAIIWPVCLLAIFAYLFSSCGPSSPGAAGMNGRTDRLSPLDSAKTRATWADSVLAKLTLEEKVGQLIMPLAYGEYLSTDSEEYTRLVHLVRDLHVGGLVVSLGDVYEEAILLNRLQQAARIPLLVAGDFERGLAMRVRRSTSFPDAMALGATRDPDMAYRMARVVAEEARAIGIHQTFAPVADVNTNPANPVINTRSFGDNVALVQSMVGAFVRGTTDGGAIGTAKHFPGHGDTGIDSHLDLPILPYGKARLDSVELAPFTVAIQNGVQSVMVGHLAVPAYDPDAHLPASLSRSLVTGVLKERIGFQGLIVTDALVMQGISREYSVGQAVVMAMNAGNDILLTPADDDVAINVLLQAVRGGEIPMARIDSSVKKILETKQALRLNERRLVDIDRIAEVVGTRPHLALAKEIARGAITVIRNDGNLLPLGPLQKRHTLIVVVNDVDENRTDIHRPTNPAPSEPAGDYFVQCVRRRNSDVEVARISPSDAHEEHLTVLRKMARADIVLVALYVRVRTSSGSISLPPGAAHFVELAQRSPTPTVVISFGTPYVLAAFPEARALMCAYGDEEPVVEAAAEALFGEIDVRGKLPVSIGSAFPFGTGISYSRTFLRRDDPAVAGFDSQRLKRLQDVLTAAIRDSAFPCAQIVVAKDGIVVCNRSFGTYTYDLRAREIEPSTLFDLASLTKVVATTAAVMKLYDSGKIHLEDQVYSYIPQLSTGDKRRITVRDLLLHRGGFPPFRKFFEFCRTPEEILDSVYATPLVAPPGDTTIYSDLSMITLGKVVERIAGMPVDQFVEREFYGPLGMKNTMFNPPAQLWPRVAPTEIDTVWRKRLVLGTVHDENAAALGGVSGHAGLFSTASDLAVFVQMLLNGGTYGGVRYLSQKTVETFTRPAAPGQDRVLGWDLKSPEGSSAGSLFSPSSFGHTGFTGTSIWVDPERSLFVILLTNRVYPTRANLRIARVRPVVHDAVINALVQ